jgi:hypothetical protein
VSCHFLVLSPSHAYFSAFASARYLNRLSSCTQVTPPVSREPMSKLPPVPPDLSDASSSPPNVIYRVLISDARMRVRLPSGEPAAPLNPCSTRSPLTLPGTASFRPFDALACCHLCKLLSLTWTSKRLCHLCRLRLKDYRSRLNRTLTIHLNNGKVPETICVKLNGIAPFPFPAPKDASEASLQELITDCSSDVDRAKKEIQRLQAQRTRDEQNLESARSLMRYVLTRRGPKVPPRPMSPDVDEIKVYTGSPVNWLAGLRVDLEALRTQIDGYSPLKTRRDKREFRRGMRVKRVSTDQGEWGMRMGPRENAPAAQVHRHM